MLDKIYINRLRDQSLSYADKRRDIIRRSDDALHHAKRAIFAMHRGEMKEAEEKLQYVETLFQELKKIYPDDSDAWDEGAYHAAMEEYVEAQLLHQFLTTGEIGKIAGMEVDDDIYIAGLCDVPGELYRYAIRAATQKDRAMVKKCADMGEEIAGALIEFNLTSYLRNKFDQAKQAVRRLEEVVYETAIRENKK